MHKLISLQYLHLWRCPHVIQFPEGGLPPNLTSLTVGHCENLKQQISEWGLGTLTSLKRLIMEGSVSSTNEIVSFPDNDDILPSSMTILHIDNFENVESISSSLQSLTSLQQLGFSNCPKLLSLPKEGLPDSLGKLVFTNCPIGERCIKERGGDYWPCIAHIPFIQIQRRYGVESKIYTGGFNSQYKYC